jgi:hypothetical protein
MRFKALASTAATAALAFAAPGVATAAPVDVVDFTLSPTCVRPGGQVTAHVTLRNNTAGALSTYAQSWVGIGPLELSTGGVEGPFLVPPLSTLSQDKANTVGQGTPPGVYQVNLGVGPSADSPRSWSQRSALLVVSPFFC